MQDIERHLPLEEPEIVTTRKLNWLLGKQGRDKSEKICVWQILPVSPFVSLFSNSGSLYTGSLLPSPPFPVSSDENLALVNPHLCIRPPLYFPFFSCSYNLIYYFAERHVFFSSAIITMYVILLNAFREFHTREYMIKSFLFSCILLSFIFLTIKYMETSFVFVKYNT